MLTFEEYTEEKFIPPKGAQKNAQKAIEWKEKYKNEVKAGTRVGWVRARQLANGDAISLDIVQRMANFQRHRKNSTISPENKNTPWRDNGYVSWLLWGGDEGVNWAIKKIQEIKNKSEATEMKKNKEYLDELVNEKESEHTQRFKKIYKDFNPAGNDRDSFTAEVARVSGIPKKILDEVYDRGIGAGKSAGMRPNVDSVEQWAKARVYSFVTKQPGTWGKADKDLAQKIEKK